MMLLLAMAMMIVAEVQGQHPQGHSRHLLVYDPSLPAQGVSLYSSDNSFRSIALFTCMQYCSNNRHCFSSSTSAILWGSHIQCGLRAMWVAVGIHCLFWAVLFVILPCMFTLNPAPPLPSPLAIPSRSHLLLHRFRPLLFRAAQQIHDLLRRAAAPQNVCLARVRWCHWPDLLMYCSGGGACSTV